MASSGSGGGGMGDCCVDNGSPGCDDAACEATVCAADPFCCSNTWDGICAGAAATDCGGLCGGGSSGGSTTTGVGSTGPGGAGDCCVDNGTPGCDDAACEATVCAADPFCCSNTWDGICAGAAATDCGGLCGGGSSGGSTTTGVGSTGIGSTGPGGAGDCCVDNGTPGCDDAACEATVCAADPFCCSNTWDGICAGAAATDCGGLCGGGSGGSTTTGVGSTGIGSTGPGGAGDCCVDNGTPGCDDAACEATVCAADPFCCSNTWDGICAGAAATDCGGLCGGATTTGVGATTTGVGSTGVGGAGDCCVDNGTPGCDDAACEAAVCAVDPFCCSNTWDGLCAGTAATECPGLCGGATTTGVGATTTGVGGSTGVGGAGDCCVDNGTPGCDDAACEATVCAADPFCCSNTWDGICAGAAATDCGGLCGGATTTGVGATTTGVGGSTGVGGAGDCCVDNGTPGCDDAACEATVCAADPFCCSNTWDGICAGAAATDCGGLCGGATTTGVGATTTGVGGSTGVGGAGDCCVDNGTPGCDDAACEATVCAADPFCCSNTWDGICAGAAATDCGGLCGGATTTGVGATTTGVGGSTGVGGAGDCCVDNGTPGCDDAACEATVCAADPFCCSNTWDGVCAGAAATDCGGLCGGGSTGGGSTGVAQPSDCCINNGTPGCDDAACEATVCAADPFCCSNTWDGICSGAAATDCGALCGGVLP